MHDLGKAASAWQKFIRHPIRSRSWCHRHEVLSLAFLPWVAAPDSNDFAWIAAAIASHHRDAPLILEDRYPLANQAKDLHLAGMVSELPDDAILGIAWWLGVRAPSWLEKSTLVARGVELPTRIPADVDPSQFRRDAPDAILAALRAYETLWRVQRSGSASDAERRQGVLLRGLLMLSDHLASGHAQPLARLNIPSASELLHRAGAPSERTRSHQERAASTEGSTVLAAPTGSGKTEAALLWARHQLEQPDRARKLIYLLPYQASLNAMRTRLETVLGVDVGLLHARSSQVLYRELVDDGHRGQDAERKARQATDLARLHHPPVWVATPYQILRAAYRLRGYETIWTSLGKSLVVIDEPHAYEPKRLGLLLGLLGVLVKQWDVRVCAMTATLPACLRSVLEEALGTTSMPVDRGLFAQFRRHRLQLLPGEILDEAAINRIVDQVEAGQSVLVGVNTVARAQQVYGALQARLGDERVRLLHSRFTGRDRLAKEQEIMERLRAGATRAERLAVVATQVVEVSLDLDFDTIYTEPAPLEALAQRFGRVNRRGAKGVVPVYVHSAPSDGQRVYDPRLVRGTLRQLNDVDGQILDEALLGDYLDTIYAREGLDREFKGMVDDSRSLFNEVCIERLHAFESDDALEEDFDKLFEGTEVLPASLGDTYRRLAEESILAAQSLLVPVRDAQRRRLGKRATWDNEAKVWVVDVPYDENAGLQLNSDLPIPLG